MRKLCAVQPDSSRAGKPYSDEYSGERGLSGRTRSNDSKYVTDIQSEGDPFENELLPTRCACENVFGRRLARTAPED